MADQANTPETPKPVTHHELIEDRIETVRIRRSPKYSVFLVAGAALGIIVAMILTFSFTGTTDESPNTGMIYSQGQVFGFLALICIAGGVALAGAVALVFDRTVGRRTRDVEVDRETVHVVD
ncbi:potassium transporter Trk [Microbacterium ulmi]|uniref:Potassium transporter Trk n=1 Tax=Microbacterium ulmi TaxID=179095 RepID=A0A7Y2Q0P4_9MICO|nr:potassium transporter Trk [Microbacterium ulmi]NII69620.1 hypothetical protein [Microbacterium ulmi]NNH03492.1 potassium transporter Trk [Microbacterium ulmi]